MKPATRWILIIVTVLALGALVTLAYFMWWQPERSDSQNTSPTPNTNQTETPTKTTRTFTSARGVEIQINDWPSDGVVTSPLTLTGEVPGSWSFEGTFPIEIVYEDDIGLPGVTATLQGDWMTDEMVPFTATLTFDENTMASDNVRIVLHNANPSGLPENDDSLALDVRFEP